VTASVSFMLALNLGGREYSWFSPAVLGLFAIALVIGVAFVMRLTTAPEPLIPIAILRDRSVRCCVAAHAFGWGAIIGLNIFLPTYLQNVVGLSATRAGLSLMPLMFALNISAGLSGYALGYMVHYKVLPLTGLLLAIASIVTLAWRVDDLSLFWFVVLLVLIGVGFGPLPGLSQAALQNSVRRHQLGISVGTMNFCRNLLATMLVAVFGAIVAGSVAATTGDASPGNGDIAAATEAFRRVFFAAAATLTVAFFAIVLLEEKPLQSGEADNNK
jgi:MFS family permease